MTTCPPAAGPGCDQPSQALAGPAPSPLGDCPARPPRYAPGRPLAPASLPAPLRAAALLGLALLAAAPPAQAAKPVLRSTNPVTTSGTQVTLHYDQSLASGKRPSGSQFTVTVGGQTVTPSGTGVGGTEVRVFVGFRIAPDEAVTIAYAKPTPSGGNQPIQNSAGEEADSFSAKTATTSETWSATALDAAASESSIAGHVVALRFTAALLSSPPFSVPASAFTVTVDGTAQTPGAYKYVPKSTGGKGLIALQTLPTAIKSGQTVQVSYAPPLGATHFTVSRNRLWGSDDKLVQRFTTQTITNNTALVANTTKGTQTHTDLRLRSRPGVHHRQPRHPAGRRVLAGFQGNGQGRSGLHRQHPLVQRFRPAGRQPGHADQSGRAAHNPRQQSVSRRRPPGSRWPPPPPTSWCSTSPRQCQQPPSPQLT